MTDVNLKWDNPPSSLGIKELKIFKIAEDYTEKNHAVFIEDSQLLATVPMTAPNVDQIYVDNDVAPGTYTYGIFSSNNLGLGPGDLIDSAVVIIPPLQIEATSGYIGYTGLSWAITYTGETSEYSSFAYEISTSDTDFESNIVDTETRSSTIESKLFSGLTSQQSYFFRVKAEGPATVYSNISEAYTDPCTEFSAVRTDDGDGTYTLKVTTNNVNEGVYLAEEMNNSDFRALVRPLADDEFGNLFIAVGEGKPYDPETDTSGGTVIFDAAMPKFYDDIKWSSSAPLTVRWKDEYKNDIYGSNTPGEYGTLTNYIKHSSRKKNPTGKVLYFNDTSYLLVGSNRNNYGIAMYDSTFNGCSEAAGKTFHYFKDLEGSGKSAVEQTSEDIAHYQWVQDNPNESEADYKNYFEQFDTIIWLGATQNNGSNGMATSPVASTRWVPQNMINALLDYFDGGGGFVFITDHSVFQYTVNTVIKHFGVQFTGSVNRNAGNSAYKVSNILNNTEYIPNGFHPVFENIPSSANLFATEDEGKLAYYNTHDGLTSTDPNDLPTARTSSFVTDSNKEVTADAHNDNTPFAKGKIIVRTASGCGLIIPRIND